jgi:predicted phosphodiesterase
MNKIPKITAVLSDIHGNLDALTAVLSDIEKRGHVDCVVCLGDIIGYGPDPLGCLDIIREKASLMVAGNHDQAVGSEEALSRMNPDAASLIRWSAERLGSADRRFLFALPLEAKTGPFHFVHGSPYQPDRFNYILNPSMAKTAFLNTEKQFSFVGHSHIPSVFIESDYRRMFAGLIHDVQLLPPKAVKMIPRKRYLINVGSVGQPRDGDTRAAYGLVDTEAKRYKLVRVGYDVDAVVSKMKHHGLPDALAHRLTTGR